jgi:tetratricopeptide (TPR) repeat protein
MGAKAYKALADIIINGLLVVLVVVPALAFLPVVLNPRTPQKRLDRANKDLTAASTEEKRFYALDDAAKENFNVGKIEDADNYAKELLKLAPSFQGNWNYGNAIQDGNLVLGRIAVRDGQIEVAKKYLLEAGKSPGSPTMDSFGPSMSLAKDLLEKGERDTVLQYFELCRKFWKDDYGKLDQWSDKVKAGKIPHFGVNLVY